MELNKSHLAIMIVCFVAGCIIGAGLRSCSSSEKPNNSEPLVIHDTVRMTDTLRIIEHTKPKNIVRHDTVFVPVPTISASDSANDSKTDSIAVDIPIMQYEYCDTFKTDSSRIELGVKFSGYNARIDDVNLNSQFNVEPRTVVKKNGWGQFIGVGIGVGVGATAVGHTVYAGPEISLNITYGWGYHW